MPRSRRCSAYRAIVFAALLVAAALCLMPGASRAAPNEAPADAPLPQDVQPQWNALYVCLAAPAPKPEVPPPLDAQLREPANRIESQDFSGQDLAGRDFRNKLLLDVKLKGANLRGADLTGAVICNSDLTNADLTGARLDRTLIGGHSEMNGANLTDASARDIDIANALGSVRIDGADLRGARVVCDADDSVHCLASGITFASVVRADLRGATVDHLCCAPAGLETAQLDGVTTHLNGSRKIDFAKLAAGAGEAGQIRFKPDYGFSGRRMDFSGKELRELATIVPRMHAAAARPSFDCARAASRVEKTICADPKLAALDRALAWIWQRVPRSPQQKAAQQAWLGKRAQCPPPDRDSTDAFSSHAFGIPADPQGCIGIAYAGRIRELAPVAAAALLENGTYTTDRPLMLPRDASAALAEKFIVARGYRLDQITVATPIDGAGPISGSGSWANGHQCSLAPSQAETTRAGARFRITDNPAMPDEAGVSFAVTPQIVLRAGGHPQFQCGARGGWSEVYFRQPDALVAKVKSAQEER